MNSQDAILKSIEFIDKNYNYSYMSSMFFKADMVKKSKDNTLIIGNSYALYGIKEDRWKKCVNLSMHSQDIYYDYKCAQEAIRLGWWGEKCIIIIGYYIAYQDISRSVNIRPTFLGKVYIPILSDANNWDEPCSIDPWRDFPDTSEFEKNEILKLKNMFFIAQGNYFGTLRKRISFFKDQERPWSELSDEERDKYGVLRTNCHNKFVKRRDTFEENRLIFHDFVDFLIANNIQPILVIPPFTEEYNRYLDPEFKVAIRDFVKYRKDRIVLTDLNDLLSFPKEMFEDTDHMNEEGANKLSSILASEYGN